MQKRSYILCLFILICFATVFFAWKWYEDYYNFNRLYEQEKYNDILESLWTTQSPEMLHNLWNAAFSQFSASGSFSEISFLQSALNYYSGSLNISENADTRYNYNLSKALLDIFSQEEEQKQETEEQWWENNAQNNSGENGEAKQEEAENQDAQQEKSNTPIQNSRQEEYRLSESEEIEKLSDKEEKELEEAIERLKQDQVHNQNFYGKKEQKSDFQNIFESFFGSIDRGGEKDW